MKQIFLFAGAIIIGFALAYLITWLGWTIQIKDRAFHCNDGLPFTNYQTSMSSHRDAGDILSPRWTWDAIERIGRFYRFTFYLIWLFSSAALTYRWTSNKRAEQGGPGYPPQGVGSPDP